MHQNNDLRKPLFFALAALVCSTSINLLILSRPVAQRQLNDTHRTIDDTRYSEQIYFRRTLLRLLDNDLTFCYLFGWQATLMTITLIGYHYTYLE